MNTQGQLLSEEQIKAEQNNFITKVYAWMTLALIITGFIAEETAASPKIVSVIFENEFIFWILLIAEFLCVAFLVTVIKKISSEVAILVFILYSALNGLTMSLIFVIFTKESIAITFFITAGTFGIMSIYGYITKKDLTTFGNIAIMGLIGLIITSVINYYLNSELLFWITTFAGIIIFVSLIAYDTQKIKNLNIIGNEGTEEDKKESIMGALTLYLDFINLFLMLLRLFGKKK